MADPLSTRVACTFPDCPRYFKSIKEMRKHKITDPEHEYCRKCDEDFQSEEKLLIHKIKSNKHVVCPLCGCDFGSEGGRDAHIRQHHRSSQNLTCCGCKTNFKSASGLMRHIEDGECPEISQDRLLLEQSKKLMIKEALELGSASPIFLDMRELENSDGGVKGGPSTESVNREAMANQPKAGEDDPIASASSTLAFKHWPRLGDRDVQNDLLIFSELSLSNNENIDESNEGKGKEKENENSGWKGEGKARSEIGSETTSSQHPAPLSDSINPGLALRTMDSRWDPTKFFNSFSGDYVCPCGKHFLSTKELEAHVVAKSKADRRVQCPGCLRIFKSTAALVAHYESATTRCDINEGNKYAQIIDEITGGFIQTAGYNEDGTMKYEAGELELTKKVTIGTDLNKVDW